MKRWIASALVAVFGAVGAGPFPSCCAPTAALAQQKKEIKPGVYMETLKSGDNVDASIARGRKLFNDHSFPGVPPRRGTNGGTAKVV